MNPQRDTALPSRRQAWERLAAAAPPAWVLDHCRCVEALAVAMAQRAQARELVVDADLVARGALLHDIGRSKSQGVDHAHLGAGMLRAPPRMPEALARIVETHTGAGLTAQEAAAAGLPPLDYIPRTLEQRIVAHADNLYSGDKRLRLDQVLAKYQAKGLTDAAARIQALHEELGRLLDTDLEDLAPAGLPAP